MGICIAYNGKLRDPALIPELVRDLTAKAEAAGWLYKTMKQLRKAKLVHCADLEGITLYPHRECEPLHFHFDGEGTFINHTYHNLLTDKKRAKEMIEAMVESTLLTRDLTGGSREKAGPNSATPKEGPKGGGKAPRVSVSVSVPELPEAPGADFFKEGSRYNWTKTQFAGSKVHVAVCAVLRYVKQRYAPELEVKDDSGYFADGDYEKLQAELAYVDRICSLASQAIGAAASSSAGKGPMSLDTFVERINEELAEAGNKLH